LDFAVDRFALVVGRWDRGMPTWNQAYVDGLRNGLDAITDGLGGRLDAVVDGRVAPSVDKLAIGSARKLRASTLFFDIRGFTQRNNSSDLTKMKKTLYMLDCVIPMMMQVVFDHGGYVEKNTGDGIMALLGINDDDSARSNLALDAAGIMFYVLRTMVNPHLEEVGVLPVDARIGIAQGTLLLARIGKPRGTAKHDRSHLTAVGPSANLAAKLQERAGTNEIWVDDLVRTHAKTYRSQWFVDKTPQVWTWTWASGDREGHTYRIWKYTGKRSDPE
jgi:adenylate cyclase